MSTLADRLRGILPPQSPPVVPGFGRPPGGDLEAILGGAWHADRRSFVVERRVPGHVIYGRTRVEEIATELKRAARDAPLLVGGAPARLPFLFFDLETTGLNGGAGTYAFLIGCGWFEDDGAFLTRQYLLATYGIERGMLERVSKEFARAGALVSFNGKSFDAPVLETRYLFHRIDWPGGRLPHVDVLHPARQFWAERGPERGASPSSQTSGCSLIVLERQILGTHRHGDVPGFEIPRRYFQFVRTGHAALLEGIFEHNRLDLLSLAGLTMRLLQLVCDGPLQARDAREALALGRVYARAGLDVRAREGFQRALSIRSSVFEEIEGLRALATLLGRARQYEEAATCWRRLLDIPGCPDHVVRQANEALAIHHEHRVRDLPAARTFALQSFEAGSDRAWNDAVRYRLARLERKMTNGQPLFPSWSSRPSSGSPGSAPRTSS